MYDIMVGMDKMYDFLIPIQYVCMIVLAVEGWIVFRKSTSKVHLYLFFSIIVNLVNSAGYLFELKAHSSEAYLTALKMSYIGRVWVAFSLFLFVNELCSVKVPGAVKIGLALFHTGTYIAVLTIRTNDLFYKDVDFIYVDGYIRMMRTSGIVHKLQSVSVAVYIVYILTVLIITRRRTSNKRTRKCLTTVMISMITQAVFAIFQIFVRTPITYIYDLTMPGFAIGTLIMLVAILRFDLLGTEQIAKEYINDKLSEGIIAVDNSGDVRYFNEPAKKLFPELQMLSKSVPAEVTEAAATGSTLNINDRVYKPEENELTRDGDSFGKLYALVDETEHYRYMEVLEEQKMLADSANQAKSTFLANMSHDIRTPINAVLGMNEMILRECDDSDILGYSEKIRSAGNTLLGLINDILDLSKIEAGKLDIIPVDYDLTSVLNDLVNMIQPRAEAKGLALETRLDGNIPKMLRGDEIRIKQIVTNILTNAVKYTEKGSVTFALTYEKCGENSILLKFSVSDTGIGIKPEDIPKLFSAFDRIEEERNRSIEGTGLGMSITQKLLEMMNSKLEVTSEYGKGSTFSFAIEQEVMGSEPVGDLEEALRRSLANRRKYREKFTAPDAHILVVDDTPMNLEVFVNLLKKTLVRIDTAASGAECLVLAAKEKYDIIFLDHMMPDKDGIETLKEMKALTDCPNNDTPTVCLTANAVSGARETYLDAGFDDYLTKPVEPEKLEDMLIKYLPEKKLLDAAGTDISEEEKQTLIPGFVRTCEEINVKQGIRHCGSEDVYLETLTTYASSVNALSDEIEGYLNCGDTGNFTVKVHAIKSTSRVIGAMGLGDLAEKLEAAGHANDTAFISANTDALLTRCRRLGEQLAPLLQREELPLISDEELHEAFTLIREFLSVEDYESVMQVIDGLRGYSYPEKEKQRCEALKKAADEFGYEAMNGIMGD